MKKYLNSCSEGLVHVVKMTKVWEILQGFVRFKIKVACNSWFFWVFQIIQWAWLWRFLFSLKVHKIIWHLIVQLFLLLYLMALFFHFKRNWFFFFLIMNKENQCKTCRESIVVDLQINGLWLFLAGDIVVIF